MKTILYVGCIGPQATAMQIHTYNIAKIMKSVGYNVVFLDYHTNQISLYERIDGFEYYYVDANNKRIPGIRSIQQTNETLFGIRLYNKFKQLIIKYQASAVILFGFYAEKKIYSYCKRNRIPLFIDRCDWFEKDHYSDWMSKELFYPRIEKLKAKLDIKTDGVIAISPYLTDYYRKSVPNTLFLPPVFEIDDTFTVGEATPQGCLKLVYAGSMGKTKDIIWPAVEAVSRINSVETRIDFDIVGPNEKFLSEMTKNTGVKLKGIHIHGRQPHDITEKIVQNADFSVLLREAKKYAVAGFSTKFAESMSLGVPVICNAVGGADSVIRHMHDGIIIKNNTVEEIISVLNMLLCMTKDEKKALKINAREYAVNHFSTLVYKEKMESFLRTGINTKWGKKENELLW